MLRADSLQSSTCVPAFTAEGVLRACDEAADQAIFPMLDNGYYYPVDVRMHAFARRDQWLLLIETVGYNQSNGNLADVVTRIGAAAGESATADMVGFFDRLDNHDDLLNDDDSRIRAGAPAAVVRGRSLPTPRTVGCPIWEFCRTLVPEHRDLLLMNHDEVDQFRPSGLPLILRLEEWRHPDLLADEMPSDTETFRQIARALQYQDPALYRPAEAPNTHWSNWPHGGTL